MHIARLVANPECGELSIAALIATLLSAIIRMCTVRVRAIYSMASRRA